MNSLAAVGVEVGTRGPEEAVAALRSERTPEGETVNRLNQWKSGFSGVYCADNVHYVKFRILLSKAGTWTPPLLRRAQRLVDRIDVDQPLSSITTPQNRRPPNEHAVAGKSEFLDTSRLASSCA